MNAAGVNALRSALGNVEDNLYRYRHFADVNGVDGNGTPIREIIERLVRERDDLRAAIDEARSA